MRRILVATAAASAALLGVPGIASADTTIGSTTQPSGSTGYPGHDTSETFVQTGSAGLTTAVPAPGGRIMSWATNTSGATPGQNVNLVVLRPMSSGGFTVVAVDSEDLPSPLPASGVASFALANPISVTGGDRIGINMPFPNAVAFWDSAPATDTIQVEEAASPSSPRPGQTINALPAPGDHERVNLSAVISTTVDVGVTTSTPPQRSTVGNPAVLQSTVTNRSPGSVPVTFTDTVPAGLNVIQAFAGGNGSCPVSGQTVTCTIPNVPNGAAVPVNVLVTPKAAGGYANRVSVAPGGGLTDPSQADNSASAALNVTNAGPTGCVVPKLRGTPARVAKRVLKLLGCKVKVKRKKGRGVAKGTVLKTKPGPGTYKLGRKVTLIVRK